MTENPDPEPYGYRKNPIFTDLPLSKELGLIESLNRLIRKKSVYNPVYDTIVGVTGSANIVVKLNRLALNLSKEYGNLFSILHFIEEGTLFAFTPSGSVLDPRHIGSGIMGGLSLLRNFLEKEGKNSDYFDRKIFAPLFWISVGLSTISDCEHPTINPANYFYDPAESETLVGRLYKNNFIMVKFIPF
uniref:hypothetical protein n=1 Tax=Eustigmatophyceae sp. WTwin 8/9 T-6m6.8 TaxID=2974615 RepID=UPI002182548E|nr:hypothetical protein N4M30_pgp049 [Eustigmatophyceae sp. WTwin 8/9 T-6m6.8]UVI61007.1 hypothetical protein [Eustigmatophyceae sp. WTwin 8/9 T-6m6.8]